VLQIQALNDTDLERIRFLDFDHHLVFSQKHILISATHTTDSENSENTILPDSSHSSGVAAFVTIPSD
jgi:hypothetical protein